MAPGHDADVARLLVVGSGTLSPMVAQVHAPVRDCEVIEIWGRDAEKAQKVVSDLAAVRLAFERDPGSPSVLTLPSP